MGIVLKRLWLQSIQHVCQTGKATHVHPGALSLLKQRDFSLHIQDASSIVEKPALNRDSCWSALTVQAANMLPEFISFLAFFGGIFIPLWRILFQTDQR